MSKKMQEEFFEDVSYTTYSLLLGAFMYIDNIDDAFLPPEIKSIKRQIEKIFIKAFDFDEARECIESGLIVKKRFGLTLQETLDQMNIKKKERKEEKNA